MSMMSSRQNKRIPQKLSECTQTSSAAADLYNWADRIHSLAIVLAVVLSVVGLVLSIQEARKFFSFDAKTGIKEFFKTAAEWGIYALIEFFVCQVLIILINALAAITQNTHISASVALYEAAKNEAPVTGENAVTVSRTNGKPASVVNTAGWTCTACGTSNKNEHGQCKKCGQFR